MVGCPLAHELRRDVLPKRNYPPFPGLQLLHNLLHLVAPLEDPSNGGSSSHGPSAVFRPGSSSAFILSHNSASNFKARDTVLCGGERARVIDQEQIPGGIDEPVPEVGIDVANQVVEHLRPTICRVHGATCCGGGPVTPCWPGTPPSSLKLWVGETHMTAAPSSPFTRFSTVGGIIPRPSSLSNS